MTISLTELLNSFEASTSGWKVTIPSSWMQGRTAYGGLSAALCAHAIKLSYPELPPLRSAHISFIGPTGGNNTITTQLLRQGKSVTFIEATQISDKGIATKAIFCFGADRESRIDSTFLSPPDNLTLDQAQAFFPNDEGPAFTQYFDCRLAQGAKPFTNSNINEHFVWIRFKEEIEVNMASMLALGDMPPPAVLPMIAEPAPTSSMNWAVNFVDTTPRTNEGWWLMRTAAEDAKDGYSSQDMQVWNQAGDLVLSGRQSVALFY